ncbi:MAG: ABC transporter permease [Streptosporangiaceae bacterium]
MVRTLVRGWIEGHPWVATLVAAVGVWLGTIAIAGGGAASTLRIAAILAVFYVIAGIGQMLVISGGNGQIDLSIPYVMTLSGFLALEQMDGSNSRLVTGLLIGLACGLVVGVVNTLVIRVLLIPPIVATLAVGFVADAIAITRSRTSAGSTPSPALKHFTYMTVGGVPIMPLVFLGVAFLAALLLHRTTYGRSLLAYGQNSRAAFLARVRIPRTVAISYIISGGLAGLSGVLLASYSGGATLDMATIYLLGSIAVVVLGGTSIAGGRASVTGLWTAAIFLTLLTNLLNVARLGADWQDIVEGLVILVVLAAFGTRRRLT